MDTTASRLITRHSGVAALLLLIAFLCCAGSTALAQAITATISGMVTDPAGRVVANADVSAKDLDRGTVWPAHTNGSGLYNLTRLPVGRYEVRVSAPGFRTAVESLVELQLNQVAAINVQLKLGENAEVVQVNEEAPLLQTQTTEVGVVLDARANVDLPLATRNYTQLTLLSPGAVTPSPTGFTNGQTTGETSRPEINGNRFTANDYVLDGMDNNQMSDNFVGYAPQPDAIQEFNLITQNAPADFGNYMGGIISAAIKSGTNQFHGSAFEFFRNNVLNANQWSSKLVTPFAPRAALRWNEFGAAVGGPILHNKLFFFVDYQGERFDTPSSSSFFSVMTANERTGNVSELVAAGYTIKDPKTGLPFPGNQIPELSKAALAIINSPLYPTPVNGSLTLNAINTKRIPLVSDQGDGKVDWALSQKDHWVGRYSQSNTNDPTSNSYNFAYNNTNLTNAWNFVTGYTRTISANLVNDARLGVNYVQVGQGHVESNFDGNAGTLFGIAGLPTPFLPAIQFTGKRQATGPGNSNTIFGTKDSVNDYYDTVIQYQDVVDLNRGKHSMRIGFQGWRTRQNGFFPSNGGLAGNFQFTGQYSGSSETDFLLGLPGQINVGTLGPDWGHRGNIFAGFFQDDWKLSERVTLNLGVRYEDHTPWFETKDKQVNFDPDSGALELPGQGGLNRALYNNYNGYGNYQPRIGIAYMLDRKTTFRASYGLSSFMEGTGQGLRLPQNPPSAQNVTIDYRTLSYPTTTLDQGFSTTNLGAQCTLAGLQTASPLCYKGALLLVWDKNVQPAHSSQYSMFIQRELTPSSTFQIGYVGQSTRHLTAAERLNQPVLNADGTTSPAPYFNGNPAVKAQVGNIFGTYSPANQNYNSLQVELQGRLHKGLSYLLSYTWARCMTNSQGFFGESGQSSGPSAWWQDQYNPKADYGGCYYNVKGDFTGYVIYDLPFGRGRMFGANMNRIEDVAVGGWRVSVIPTIRGGFPITLSSANDESNTNAFQNRPDCNGPGQVLHKQQATSTPGYQWFSPAPYSEPRQGTFGNCKVSSVYGPGEQNLDIGLSKSFTTFHEQNLEFRSEFINAFNHVILDAPNNTIGSNMGVINSSEGARNIQFALKYNF